MLPKTITSFTSKIMAITVKHVAIIADMLVLNPSIPSVRFIAFVVPSITNITKGMYKSIGSTTYFLAKGIKVDVGIKPSSNSSNIYKWFVTTILLTDKGPKESGVTSLLPNPTTSIFLSFIFPDNSDNFF